ncbi:MAG: O-methyltransferase [Firmicutes bacterium]|nr:O-methyltransferase [Bacillota bacterium]
MNITNPVVEDYLNGYYKPVNAEMSEFRALCEEKHVPIILRDTEGFLRLILKMTKPSKILEIGTAVGYSAACFAHLSPESKVTTIEREEQAYKEALENIARLGLSDRIECLIGDAVEVLNELYDRQNSNNLEPYDFVFIDAGKSHYAEFLECSLKLSKPGTVIVCDNILMKAKTASDEYDPHGKYKTNIRKMREFVNIITTSDKLETSVHALGDGISISIVK